VLPKPWRTRHLQASLSRGSSSCSLRVALGEPISFLTEFQLHLPDQSSKPRIGANGVQSRVDLQEPDPKPALVTSLVEPLERTIAVSKPDIDLSKAKGRD